MNTISLETKKVIDLNGKFCVPAYQRGYRWTDEAVKLIEDIMEFDKAKGASESRYCLQPIVVKKKTDGSLELIDGQQRLTTLILIYKVMKKYVPFAEAKFRLSYEIRDRTEEFLETLSRDSSEENIDFFYIKRAFLKISDWFERQNDPSLQAFNLYKLLSERVDVIWYEVDENEDSNSLFQRLNIGKIPLTSSELVKAIFLSESSRSAISCDRQKEIALQWDTIEKELHYEPFWGFLTNPESGEFQTRIDLILDLDAGSDAGPQDKYRTFFYFDDLRKTHDLTQIWQRILHTFLILKDWYANHEFYHKIGYLIAVGTKLSELFALAEGRTKKELVAALDKKIADSVSSDVNYGEMSYEVFADYKKIAKLLLLFNVESTRKNGKESMWFPFYKYKKGKWSIEHIHAQHSEGMKTVKEWKEWLGLHLESVKTVGELRVRNGQLEKSELENMIKRITDMTGDGYPTEHFGDEFKEIRQSVESILSDGAGGYLHSISNLALLNVGNNAALSNSAFDAKRNKIIELDKKGDFIPYCTKMVFLKYYTHSDGNQVHFWSQTDRECYLEAINSVLAPYLTDRITMIGEEHNDG